MLESALKEFPFSVLALLKKFGELQKFRAGESRGKGLNIYSIHPRKWELRRVQNPEHKTE